MIPRAERTVAAGYARGLIEFAVSKGASGRDLRVRSGIAAKDLLNVEGRIPLSRYVTLMRVAKELCDDPALALHFGEAGDVAEMSILGLMARSAATTGEVFALLNHYGRLVVDADSPGPDRFQLLRDRGQLWMVDTREHPNEFPELTESTFARLITTSRTLLPRVRIVLSVHFTHAAPAYLGEYERIFRVPIVFESDRNGGVIDESWDTHGVARQPRYAMAILSPHAEALLDRLDDTKSMRGRVEGALTALLPTGHAPMSLVARELRLSRQTLHRRLKAEGVTFERVLDELRHRLARRHLSAMVSVTETARLVGFSDPTAFSRAFKRWTGRSPRSVRGIPID